jgi:hypothetical protein
MYFMGTPPASVDTQKRLTTRERYVVSVLVSMSDLGHERHFERAPAMSALPPIGTESLHCDK